MRKILVSACLLGERVRYHGGDAAVSHPILARWRAEGRLVVVCPEVDGGLTTPRPPAELVDRPDGRRVLTVQGADVTSAFENGAHVALNACAAEDIRIAILKDGSPSCGSRTIYDGRFSGRRVPGQGLTAERLSDAGVKVFSEDEIDQAAAYLSALERSERD